VPEEDAGSLEIERSARQWESSLMPSVLWYEVCDCLHACSHAPQR